jgi:transposase InsO family protein
LIENGSDLRIKWLRSDWGGEFVSNEFEEFYELHGIKRQFSATRTPQQNGVVERKNWTKQYIVRKMLNEAKISDIFWREVSTMVYILKL